MITLKCCVKFLLLARQDLRTKAQDVLIRSRCAAFFQHQRLLPKPGLHHFPGSGIEGLGFTVRYIFGGLPSPLSHAVPSLRCWDLARCALHHSLGRMLKFSDSCFQAFCQLMPAMPIHYQNLNRSNRKAHYSSL